MERAKAPTVQKVKQIQRKTRKETGHFLAEFDSQLSFLMISIFSLFRRVKFMREVKSLRALAQINQAQTRIIAMVIIHRTV